MTGRPSVQVLCEGWLVREGGVVVDASSTVTLLEADIGRVLVDTGSAAYSDDLLSALSARGLSPEDISHVVNTHLHADHCGSNQLFADAVFYANALEDPPIGTRRTYGDTPLAVGVKLVPTPGHTRGSISVMVESERRFAICGDAVPTRANYESHTPPAIHFDRTLAVRSMEMVLRWAHRVVPGHDAPFEVLAKE